MFKHIFENLYDFVGAPFVTTYIYLGRWHYCPMSDANSFVHYLSCASIMSAYVIFLLCIMLITYSPLPGLAGASFVDTHYFSPMSQAKYYFLSNVGACIMAVLLSFSFVPSTVPLAQSSFAVMFCASFMAT